MVRNILSVLFFILFVALAWWFWKGEAFNVNFDWFKKDQKPVILSENGPIGKEKSEALIQDRNSTDVRKTYPKRQLKRSIPDISRADGKLEVELDANTEGILITRINGKSVNKRITYRPTLDLNITEKGILTYWEEKNSETKKLVYKSINLSVYVREFLDKQ